MTSNEKAVPVGCFASRFKTGSLYRQFMSDGAPTGTAALLTIAVAIFEIARELPGGGRHE